MNYWAGGTRLGSSAGDGVHVAMARTISKVTRLRRRGEGSGGGRPWAWAGLGK